MPSACVSLTVTDKEPKMTTLGTPSIHVVLGSRKCSEFSGSGRTCWGGRRDTFHLPLSHVLRLMGEWLGKKHTQRNAKRTEPTNPIRTSEALESGASLPKGKGVFQPRSEALSSGKRMVRAACTWLSCGQSQNGRIRFHNEELVP